MATISVSIMLRFLLVGFHPQARHRLDFYLSKVFFIVMEMSFYSDRKALSVVIMYLFYRLLKENVTKALIRHIYKHSPYHDIPRILSSDTSETRTDEGSRSCFAEDICTVGYVQPVLKPWIEQIKWKSGDNCPSHQPFPF